MGLPYARVDRISVTTRAPADVLSEDPGEEVARLGFARLPEDLLGRPLLEDDAVLATLLRAMTVPGKVRRSDRSLTSPGR